MCEPTLAEDAQTNTSSVGEKEGPLQRTRERCGKVRDVRPSKDFLLMVCGGVIGATAGGGVVSMETGIPLKVLGSHGQLLSLGNGWKFSVKCLKG